MNDTDDLDSRECPRCGGEVPLDGDDETLPHDRPFACPHCGGALVWMMDADDPAEFGAFDAWLEAKR